MQYSVVLYTFSDLLFDRKDPFWANLVEKVKIVSLSWNFVLRLIRMCGIQCCYLLFPFNTGNTLSGQKVKIVSLKLVSAIFYQIFIYHQMIAPQKIWNKFFISSKKLFSFSRYSSFCIFVFPSFSPCQPLL